MVVKVHTLETHTPEQQAAYEARQERWAAKAWDRVREQRDFLLKQNDPYFSNGHPLNSAAMNAYRQALLEIPQQFESPQDVVWPTNPLEVE